MRRLQDLSIGKKLGLLATVAAAVVAISGVVAMVQSGAVAEAGETVVRMDRLNLYIARADVMHSDAQLALRDAGLATTEMERQQAVANQKVLAAQVASMAESENAVLPGVSGEVRSAVTASQRALADYMTAIQPAAAQIAALPAGDPQVKPLIRADIARVAEVDAKADAAQEIVARKSAEAADALRSAQLALLAAVVVNLVVGVILIGAVSLLIARSITRPVARMVAALRAVAHRDLTVTVDVARGDEIGLMSRALGEALAGLRTTMAQLGESATTLNDSARALDTVSTTMQGGAHATAEQAGEIATSAGTVSAGAGTMAAATEELSASIRDIARNATSAAEVAQAAVQEVTETSGAVARLGVASSEIGEIVRSITAIAEQTNLLALNATIEAARAGESGKGFAVVASEVKDLAQATARATQDITGRIEAIQATAGEATRAMSGIGTVITEVSRYQTMIAAAVEQQSATTGELSRNVTEVADSAGSIAAHIGQLAEAAGTTSDSASATQRESARLGAMATRLHELVAQFRT